MTDISASPPPAGWPPRVVWVWQRVRGSVELERWLLPASMMPEGWLEPLQHRYSEGDRVRYRMCEDEPERLGTIVQDQGFYVAIDGAEPHQAATVHKTEVRPDPQPSTPRSRAREADPGDLVASPHVKPVLQRDKPTLTARWPRQDAEQGWQRHVRLRLDYHDSEGFTATLCTVEQRIRHGRYEERVTDDAVPLVFHHLAARRFSVRARRQAYEEALRLLRAYFDAGQPDVVVFFRGRSDLGPTQA